MYNLTQSYQQNHICLLIKLFQCSILLRLLRYASTKDHISVTASDQSPLKFCLHRWVKNVQVAERAIEIWPHVKAYVPKVTEKSVPDPGRTSYDTVASCTKDLLNMIKLLAFVSIAKQVTPILVKFQTDKPMLTFYCQ